MEPIVTEEQIARQTPEAQAMFRILLAEIDVLRGQMQGTTPQNSSLPPSTQPPHAKPTPWTRKSKQKRRGQLSFSPRCSVNRAVRR
jgi:hypothetical protein